MTKTIQDHLHLFAESTSPVPSHTQARKYPITMNGAHERPVTPMSIKRGITGAALRSYLPGTGGLPVTFRDGSLTLLLEKADKEAVCALSGQVCRYIPIEHDDAGATLTITDGYRCIMVTEDATHIDPMQQYWLVTVKITEDSI